MLDLQVLFDFISQLIGGIKISRRGGVYLGLQLVSNGILD